MPELTVKQYADLRGISKQAVYESIGKKTLPHKKVLVSREITVIELSNEELDRLSKLREERAKN